MIKFILRYLGVLTAGFCIGFGRMADPFVLVLTFVTAIAIVVSNITYWEMGRRNEDL